MPDGSRKCVYCGDPVHAKDWFSVMRGHCLMRALRIDCAAYKGLNDREPRSGGSAAGCGASRVTGGSGPVGDSRLHDKQPPDAEDTR